MENPTDMVGVPPVAIDWYRTLPWWPFCSRSVTIAWRLSHLLLGTLAVLMLEVGWEIAVRVFGAESIRWNGSNANSMMELWGLITWSQGAYQRVSGVRELAAVLFGGCWSTLVCASIGGLLARRSVVEFGMQTSSDWGRSYRIVSSRFLSLIWTLVMPVCAVALLLLPVVLLGWVGRLGTFGSWIANLAIVPMVVGMVAAGWLTLLSLLGFPLALVAVVTEKHADAFDGFSRSAAYLYQRPVTVGIGVGVAFLVSYVASLVVEISMGFGRDYILATYAWNAGQSIQEVQGFGFTFARWLMGSLASGFLFSFFWTASAALYLTLRNEVDHTDFDDVDMDEQPIASASEKGQAPNPQDNPALSGDNEQAE